MFLRVINPTFHIMNLHVVDCPLGNAAWYVIRVTIALHVAVPESAAQ